MPQFTTARSLVTVYHTGIISPTFATHVGYWSTTSTSHVEDLQLSTASYAGGTSLVTACHTGIISPTSTSYVGYWLTTSTSHVEYLQPATASYAGGTSPVTACHTGVISPTSASHVGDWLTTSASHVEDLQPAVASCVGITCLVTASHTAHSSPTSTSHVGDSSPTFTSHVGNSSSTSASHVGYSLLAFESHAGNMSPATASHARGIHMIEKPRHLRRKPRFLCRTCEGSHLARLCRVTAGIPEVWGSPKGPLGSEASMVSQHSIPSLVDTTIMPVQSSADTSFPLGVDASFDLVVSHPIQPVVVSMQSSTETSPMFRGDVSLDLVVSHIVQPMVMLMQSSTDNTPVFWGDTPLDLVVSYPIQPMVEEVVVSMQYSIYPTLLLESYKSKDVVTPMQFLVNPIFWFWFYNFYAMSLEFILLHLLNKREFYSSRFLSLQVLTRFPFIGMVLWGIQCLRLCLF
jgi:hypothetical protein